MIHSHRYLVPAVTKVTFRLTTYSCVVHLILLGPTAATATRPQTVVFDADIQPPSQVIFIHCFLLSSDKQTCMDYVMRRRSTCRRRIRNVVVTVTVTTLMRTFVVGLSKGSIQNSQDDISNANVIALSSCVRDCSKFRLYAVREGKNHAAVHYLLRAERSAKSASVLHCPPSTCKNVPRVEHSDSLVHW